MFAATVPVRMIFIIDSSKMEYQYDYSFSEAIGPDFFNNFSRGYINLEVTEIFTPKVARKIGHQLES